LTSIELQKVPFNSFYFGERRKKAIVQKWAWSMAECSGKSKKNVSESGLE
jgi:hypothetical protein